jgi:hypothetical protein
MSDGFHSLLSGVFILRTRMFTMVGFGQLRSVYLTGWFPCIVRMQVSLPFDEVLERSRPSMTSVVQYALDLELLFSTDKVRWWSGEVWSVCGRFAIGG